MSVHNEFSPVLILYLSGWNKMGAIKTKAFCDKKGICLAPDYERLGVKGVVP